MHVILACSTRGHAVLRQLESLVRSRPAFCQPTVVGIDELDAHCRGDATLAVVVLSDRHEYDRVHAAIRRLRGGWAGDLLVVGPGTDAKLILRSLQAGADLFLDEADLARELDTALTRVQARKGGDLGSRHLLAVLSSAGGCGASTVAVNLAVLLAKARGRCNLIDLNPRKADLAALLDLKPQYTIADLCRNEDRLDRTLYEKLLTPHASGIELLAAPRQFGDVPSITASGVAGAVSLAREAFADVVVDLEDCFHEEQLAVLEQATRVLLVCRLDFTSIRNARRILDHLADSGIARDRLEVVVNQAGLPNELPVAEAEIALGGTLKRFIPHAPEAIGWANNTGIPAALNSPTAAVVQGIARLVGLEDPTPPREAITTRVTTWFRTHVSPRLAAAWKRITRPTAVPALPPSASEPLTSHESPTDHAQPGIAHARACAV